MAVSTSRQGTSGRGRLLSAVYAHAHDDGEGRPYFARAITPPFYLLLRDDVIQALISEYIFLFFLLKKKKEQLHVRGSSRAVDEKKMTLSLCHQKDEDLIRLALVSVVCVCQREKERVSVKEKRCTCINKI